MVTVRELLGLVLAAFAAFVAFMVLSAAGGGLQRAPSNLTELLGFVRSGLWYLWPSLVIVSAVLAPILFGLRRRQRLNAWVVLGLYALYPAAIATQGLVAEPGYPSFEAALVYVASGLAAGGTYWLVLVLPSNTTPHADARDMPASASGSAARAGGRER